MRRRGAFRRVPASRLPNWQTPEEGDIVKYTTEHAVARPDQISKKSTKLVANHARAYGTTSTTTGKSLPEIDWSRRLPRTLAQVLSMPTSNPDQAGFMEATAAEI